MIVIFSEPSVAVGVLGTQEWADTVPVHRLTAILMGRFMMNLQEVHCRALHLGSQVGTETGSSSNNSPIVFQRVIGSLGSLTGSPIGGAIIARQNGSYLGAQLFCGVAILLGTLAFATGRWAQAGFKVTKV